MYQLYYYPNNASLAPHFLLRHMGLEYELLLVDRNSNAQKSADYLKLNPAGRIPTLIDYQLDQDGQAIFESAAICIHLCEQHPEQQLMPAIGSKERPLFFQWLSYLTNTLQAELMVYYYAHRHTDNEANIPSVKAAQQQRIADALAVIDQQLEINDYLLGNSLSACDFFLFMLAEWALPIERSPLTFPNLGRHLKVLAKHPTIQDVCTIEEIDLTPFT